MLRAELLGTYRLLHDGQPLDSVNAPRLQSLLAFLMLGRGAVLSRRQVAGVFWPDMPDALARSNLRQWLYLLRQAIPGLDHHLHTDANALQWRADSSFSLDVAEFEDCVVQAHGARRAGDLTAARHAFERAAALYRGDLLPGCYDDWALPERERLRKMLIEVLKQLIELLERQRDLRNAILNAERLLSLEALDEEVCAALMRLHALNGDRSGAWQVYQSFSANLKNELGIEPSEALRASYARLLQPESHAGTGQLGPAGAGDVAPLIGRQQEWERLLDSWHRAVRGQAHMTVISGEAGIGKSRLAEELIQWASRQGIGVARTRTYAAEGRLAYAPVTEWLRSPAIRGALPELDGVWLCEVARLLPELLAEMPDLPRPAALVDPSQRQRFVEALARGMLAGAQPLLLVIDDLQWCDQETLEWLRFLLRFDPDAQLLIVGALRSEDIDAKHPLTGLLIDLRQATRLDEIELKRLDAAESSRQAGHILDREIDLSEASRLFADTEGNPLFIVEMARTGLGKGIEGGGDAGLRLPPRVRAVITARMAQLSDAARDVMNLGATIGRDFRFDVLARASDADEEVLLRSLDELWRRGVLRAQQADVYDFTHDKLREVAYAQLSPAMRRLLHRRVARAIEAVHAPDLDSVSAQLAAHYQQAGMSVEAISACLRAAQVMQRRFAYPQVAQLIRQGRSLLQAQGGVPDRPEQELALLSLSSTLPVGSGLQVSEQLEMLTRAQELTHVLGRPANSSIIRMLAVNYILNTDFRRSRILGEELLGLANELQDEVLIVEANYILGISHFNVGSFERARGFLDMAISHYDPEQAQTHIAMFGWDPKVVCLCRQALNLWCLGLPDRAVEAQEESLAYAAAVAHPFSLAYTHYHGALLRYLLRDLDGVHQNAASAINISGRHGFGFWLPRALMMEAWAIGASGEPALGKARMEAGLADLDALGVKSRRGLSAVLLSELYAKLNQSDRGIEVLQLALDELQADPWKGEHWYEAELNRATGDLMVASDVRAAEASYTRAVELARSQQARSFELRAAIGLARLRQAQGRPADALTLLQPVFNWFSAGLNTHDLSEARMVLDDLTIP